MQLISFYHLFIILYSSIFSGIPIQEINSFQIVQISQISNLHCWIHNNFRTIISCLFEFIKHLSIHIFLHVWNYVMLLFSIVSKLFFMKKDSLLMELLQILYDLFLSILIDNYSIYDFLCFYLILFLSNSIEYFSYLFSILWLIFLLLNLFCLSIFFSYKLIFQDRLNYLTSSHFINYLMNHYLDMIKQVFFFFLINTNFLILIMILHFNSNCSDFSCRTFLEGNPWFTYSYKYRIQ